MKKASIIIPHFNRKEHLVQVLESLKKQTISPSLYEVIVCDDGSTLDCCLETKVLSLPKKGAAFCRNAGIQEATGEFVIFIDSDIVVAHDFVETHVAFHQRHPSSIAIGPRLHQNEDGTFQDTDVRERLLARYDKTLDQMNHPWFFGYTCNISLSRQSAQEHLFDPHFTTWGLEDTEWCYRLYNAGLKFHFLVELTAKHLFHDRQMTKEKFESWRTNLEYLISQHPRLHILNHFINVFDPRHKQDYFLSYDKFETSP